MIAQRPDRVGGGAGAIATDGWLARGARTVRRALLGTAIALSAAVSAAVGLSVLPASTLADSPILEVNPDAGELVGWPSLVDTVARVWDGLRSPTGPTR